MKEENVIQTKSFDFALRIVNFYKFLVSEKKEYVMSKQILRSGTSIGANIEESLAAESRLDFIHKLSIALKESRETSYWLRLLHKTNYMDENMFDSIHNDCLEIIKILNSIILTSKRQKQN